MSEAERMVSAAEDVKTRLDGRSAVAVGLPTPERTSEPYVVDAVASDVSRDHELWAFSPISPGPTGDFSVQIGLTYISDLPPGLLVGCFHPDGQEAVNEWESRHRPELVALFKAELERTDAELADPESKVVAMSRESESNVPVVIQILTRHREQLGSWIDRLQSEESESPNTPLSGGEPETRDIKLVFLNGPAQGMEVETCIQPSHKRWFMQATNSDAEWWITDECPPTDPGVTITEYAVAGVDGGGDKLVYKYAMERKVS